MNSDEFIKNAEDALFLNEPQQKLEIVYQINDSIQNQSKEESMDAFIKYQNQTSGERSVDQTQIQI